MFIRHKAFTIAAMMALASTVSAQILPVSTIWEGAETEDSSSTASTSVKALNVLSERPIQLAPPEVSESEDLLVEGKTILSAERAFRQAHKGKDSKSLAELASGHFPVSAVMPDPRVSTYAYNFAVNAQGVWEARLRLGNAKVCERIASKASQERDFQTRRLGTLVARSSSTLDCITDSGAIYFVVRDLSNVPFQGPQDARTEALALLDQAQEIIGAAEVWATLNKKPQAVDIATLRARGLLTKLPEPNPVVSSQKFALSLSQAGEYVAELPLEDTRVCTYISANSAKSREKAVASQLSKDVPYDCVTRGGTMTFYMHS